MTARPAHPLVRLALTPVARLLMAAVSLLLGACGEKVSEGAARLDSHILANVPSGVALELPAMWAGRYRVQDSITTPAKGLERELTVRFLKSDSTVADAPLLVIRVFSNDGWGSVPPDSAGAWWGTIVARDGARTVTVKPSPANPLAMGTPDALAYDSLMISVLARQMHASLRAPGR